MAPRKASGRPRIKDVAEDAGVSVTAVSKVLRNAYGVSNHLRAKVQNSIDRLNYRPSATARALRGQTFTLGILLPDLRNPFFADIMSGLNDALGRTHYEPLLGVGQAATSTEHAQIDAMLDRGMDGIILVAPRLALSDLKALAQQTPLVVIGNHFPGESAFDTVNNDDEHGAALAVRHLHETGRRRIAYVTLDLPPPTEGAPAAVREIGYRATMEHLGLNKHVRVVAPTLFPRDIQNAVRRLLDGASRPNAIFCWTDVVALEVLGVANDLGLHVPGDLAVVGYDNTSYCDLSLISLTSIDQSGQVLGLQAARLLIERINGRQTAEHFVVTPRLVTRRSSANQEV